MDTPQYQAEQDSDVGESQGSEQTVAASAPFCTDVGEFQGTEQTAAVSAPYCVPAHLSTNIKACMVGPRQESKGPFPPTYTVEGINDSGAGRTIASLKALENQGVPKSVLKAACKKSPNPLDFTSANGKTEGATSIGIRSSLLGTREVYNLKDCCQTTHYFW